MGFVADRPSFLPFLTLGEQVEAILRLRGRWKSGGRTRIAEILKELSDPTPGASDLLERIDDRPIRWEMIPSLAWRVGLAQEIASMPDSSENGSTLPWYLQVGLTVGASDGGNGWPARVREQVGRYLGGWETSHGRVILSTDEPAFIDRFLVDSSTVDGPPGASPSGVVAGWSWAVWMIGKEVQGRGLPISAPTAACAVLQGITAVALQPSDLATMKLLHVLILLGTFASLLVLVVTRTRRDSQAVARWFGPEGKWSDRRTIRRWTRSRWILVLSETVVLTLLGFYVGLILRG